MPGIFARSRTNLLARRWIEWKRWTPSRANMRLALRRYWRTSHTCKG